MPRAWSLAKRRSTSRLPRSRARHPIRHKRFCQRPLLQETRLRDLAGPDGQVAEMTTTGPLPCSLSAYEGIAAWDFVANFPTIPSQEDQLKRQDAKSAEPNWRRSHSAAGWRLTPVHFQRLPSTIEGDDVIVGDNPTRGTVDTSSGHEFLLGAGGSHSLSSEWQIFPSAIHYRCEKTGVCVLTRLSSRTMLQARLVQ